MALSRQEWQIEFYETNDKVCLILLYLIMIITLLMGILVRLKNVFQRNLLIFRKEVPKSWTITKIFGWKKTVLEYLLILIHPSPF